MKILKISAVFIDLFALLVFFLYVQLCLAILLIHPADEKKPTSKPRAEMIVAICYQDIKQDVDLWIRRKNFEIVGFKNREQGPFKLHGDHTSQEYGVVDGKRLEEAIEVITITKKIPGTYQISLHGYGLGRITDNTVEVVTEVEVVEPFKRLLKISRVIGQGEEVPVCEFTINSDGEVVTPVITDPDLLSKFLHLTGDQ